VIHHDVSRQRRAWRKASAAEHADPLLWIAVPAPWWRSSRKLGFGLLGTLLAGAATLWLPASPVSIPQAVTENTPHTAHIETAGPVDLESPYRYVPAAGPSIETGSIVRDHAEPAVAAPIPAANPKSVRKPKAPQASAWAKFVRSVDKLLGLAK
jgi:hypothetical protein